MFIFFLRFLEALDDLFCNQTIIRLLILFSDYSCKVCIAFGVESKQP